MLIQAFTHSFKPFVVRSGDVPCFEMLFVNVYFIIIICYLYMYKSIVIIAVVRQTMASCPLQSEYRLFQVPNHSEESNIKSNH